MKKKKHRTKSLAIFLAISICLCCISVSNVSASVVKAENDLQEERSVEQATLPKNIQSLIPEEKRGDLVVTASTDTDNAEMCTIRTENPETGEGTLFVHSSPIKYKDKNGDIHFIDTSMETISAKAKTNSGYAYRNAANSFTVEYGKTADIGINFDEAFTVVPVNNAPLERAETANASASAARPMSENGNGKLRYDSVFGADTHVEYVNTTNGIKETIILDRYTGTERFDFIFRSKTHIPLLAESGAYILVAPKDKPEEPEYRFLSLYAYDAYEPDGTASTFRHMNEDLYYELTSNTDGSFIISVVVPDGYLTHPDIVYPVTIDPSVQKVANNSNVHDTYVNEAAPTTQSYYNYDYIRFGSSNGKRMFGYIRYTELPALPTGATVTSANLKFTFRSGQNTPTATAGVSFMSLRVTAHQWNESSITWNNQPYGTEGTFTSFHYNGKYLDYVTADMTDMIRAWTSGAANYGIDFTYTDEEYNDYNSVVSSEGDADRAPVLTVSYAVPSNIPVTGITISPTNATLGVNGTKNLVATISPSNATNRNITWSSSNMAIATVSSSGLVTAKNSGTAQITAKTADGNKTAICTVTVAPNSYISISAGGTHSTSLSAGQHLWYKFIPATTGTYTFLTTGSTDTYGELFQGSSSLHTNDDGGEGRNFSIQRSLTAGTEYRLKIRGYNTTTTGSYTLHLIKDDPNEAQDNVYTGANVVDMGQTVSNHKISYSTDVDWFKVSVPTSSDYRLRVLLYKPDNDSGTGKAEIKMGLYTGTSANTLVGAAICHYDDRPASVTAQIDNYTGNKWFYVKVESSEGQHSKNNNYQIMFTFTDEPYGGEIYGWDYRGYKRSPTLNYRMSSGMDDVWRVIGGVSITYADLFQEAVDRWNAADVKGDGTPMFGINTNLLSPNVKAETTLTDATAINTAPFMDIKLNKADFEKVNSNGTYPIDRRKAVDIICHELGHSLGLDDLYINQEHGYTYTPPGSSTSSFLDNSNHLMYGWWNEQNLSGTGSARFHSNDLFGVGKIQNWFSSKHYSTEELYESAAFIVRGEVKDTQPYVSQENHTGEYTEVTFEVDEFLYSKEKISETTLTFLQNGVLGMEFAVDPLYNIGENYVLFLRYNPYGQLCVVGGAQGRFQVIEENESKKIINQMDLYVQNTMAEKLNQKKDFSIKYDAFMTTAKKYVAQQYK